MAYGPNVGLQAVFGAKRSSVRFLDQIPGTAARMSRAAFTQAMESMPSFRSLMIAYVEAFLEQVLVSVALRGTVLMHANEGQVHGVVIERIRGDLKCKMTLMSSGDTPMRASLGEYDSIEEKAELLSMAQVWIQLTNRTDEDGMQPCS